jgi:fatty acid desaturase
MRTTIADTCLVLGAGLALAGLWWIFPPAALLICGLSLLAIGARLYGAL